ncbi:MAG: copper chaperone PCu(A)C [Spongiibacteraceae bacterium]
MAVVKVWAKVLMAGFALWVNVAGAAPTTLVIRDGYVREMPPAQTVSAAFMTLQNDTAKPIALVAASSDAADRVELHNHRHTASGMRMEKVVRLEIPAKGQQLLQPGGYHLMLLGLKRPLQAGQIIRITLIDEQGRTYGASVPVTRIDTEVQQTHH